MNPSQLVVESIAKRSALLDLTDLVPEVLPTEYAEAGNRIRHLIRQYRPEMILCLGLTSGVESVRLERVALNLDDAELPDNVGLSHHGKLIIPDGPAAYWSTLPLEKMCAGLRQRGIPATISNHAGAYVCNHVFCLARHEVELLGPGSKCGFVHLPHLSGPTDAGAPHAPGLSMDVMVEAIECCISVMKK